jgi:exosortase
MLPKTPTAERIVSKLNQQWSAVAIKFSVIVAAILAFYMQDFSMVFKGALTDELTFHIIAIPFLFGYLLFRKRKMINAAIQPLKISAFGLQKYFSTLIGITLSAVAILTYWYGSYTFTPVEYHMLTLPFLAAGLILILLNPQTLKQLFFPIAFLIFLTPPPSEILYGVGSALANLSASTSNALANVFGLHATLSAGNVGPIITLLKPDQTTLSFNVNVACSGLYSIIGFVIFALFIAYITRGRIINKIAILVMGIPLIMVLNIIRITTVLAIGYNFGEDLALQGFHLVGATVLMFGGTLLLLTITEKVFKIPKPTPSCPACSPAKTNPTEPFCTNCGKLLKFAKTKLTRADGAKILSIAIITVMLLSIQAPVFALTQGPAQVISQTPQGIQINTTNTILPNIPGYTLNYLYRDTQFEQTSGDDAALVYEYIAHNNTSTVLATIQIAASAASEHRWETCLINWPLSQGDTTTVNQLDLRDIQIQDNPPITARYFAFQYKSTNQTQVVLYWYQTATFNTNSTAQTKSVMISLVMYPESAQNLSEAETQLLPIAQAINNYWAPIQTWSTVALAISQNGLALSATASALLIALIVYSLILAQQEKTQLLTLYKKLPLETQKLIKAVQETQKQNNPTTQGIADQLQQLTNQPPDPTWLKEKLDELQNAGLIKQTLVSQNDNPALAWKNQIPQKTILFKWLKTQIHQLFLLQP